MKNWQPVNLEEGRSVKIKIGDLDLQITVNGNRWTVGSRYGRSVDYSLTRIHLHKPSQTLILKPLLPDRPVVVDFENAIRIVTGHRVCFLVPIPLWAGIASGDDPDTVLMNFPTIILSNTWFGDHYSGLLSYSLKTHPVISPEGWVPSSHEALCPVEVLMESENIFSFRRICLYAHYLSIYRKADVFWTEGVIVDYPEESSVKISLSEKKPSTDDGYFPVSSPRERADKNIIERSMTLIRRYTGL